MKCRNAEGDVETGGSSTTSGSVRELSGAAGRGTSGMSAAREAGPGSCMERENTWRADAKEAWDRLEPQGSSTMRGTGAGRSSSWSSGKDSVIGAQ